LKDDIKVCEDGDVAKARHNQDWKEESQAPGERVCLDIISIKDKCYMVVLASGS
jgi:hypothetical protein